MNFDAFYALEMMREKFGDDVEILVRNTSLGPAIRLQVYRNNEWHHHEFIVSNIEKDTGKAFVLGIKWKLALVSLQRHIDTYGKRKV